MARVSKQVKRLALFKKIGNPNSWTGKIIIAIHARAAGLFSFQNDWLWKLRENVTLAIFLRQLDGSKKEVWAIMTKQAQSRSLLQRAADNTGVHL